jgi:uncharacterized protein YunC (DUF1805 family)
MVTVQPITLEGYTFIATHVKLPKTNLLVVQSNLGYVMCGALDIPLLREKLSDRGIIAARAVGVKTMEELIDGIVESCTQAAEGIGIVNGMPIKEALVKMAEYELQDGLR